MNHKFPFRIFSHQLLDLDNARFKQVSGGLPNGDYELIIRPKPNWNTEQMRKFFHGPVRDFIRAKERESGSVKSREEVKSDLKLIYGPRVDKKIGDKVVQVCKSTGDFTYKEYTQFLKDIDAFCQHNYEEGLPLCEEVD